MKIKQLIWILIILTSFGCADESTICKKYLQKRYLDSNLEHEKLFKEGDIEKAMSIVKEIIKIDSNNYVAINNYGAYRYSLCQKDECSIEELKAVYDLYKKSIGLCRDFQIGYFNLIEVLSEMSRTRYENDNEIISYLEYYNSKWGKRSDLMTKGGEAMFRLGRIEESLQYLNEATELDSSEAMAYVYKAKCYISKKDWRKAMESLNIGLSLDSLSLGFHERGHVNVELGNIDDAINGYKTAISLYTERWESYVGLGAIEARRNNLILACQYFRDAKKLIGANEVVDLWLDDFCKDE